MMTEKRFKIDDFDNEVEMFELLNIQAEIISDLEQENERLKEEIEQYKAVIDKKWSEYLKQKENGDDSE